MPPTETPENNPDPIDSGEPTDAEIAAAAEREARELAGRDRAAKKAPAAPRRGPGRPPGAKNRKGTAAATERAKSTRTTPTTPKALPAGDTGDDADREARKAAREARKRRVAELTAQAKEQRPQFVIGAAMLTGLPADFLVQPRMQNGQPVIDADTQQPIPELTVYGAQLAPKDWQIRTVAEAYVRIEETDIGDRLSDAFDKWAPYLLMVGGIGAVGFYAFTTFQIADALKPMIAEEIARAAQQQQQQQQDSGAASPAG